VKVLYIGGTGTISTSCVAESVRQGHRVDVLNRGRSATVRPLPEGVGHVAADAQDAQAVRSALAGRQYDVVANFLSYDAAHAAGMVEVFAGQVGQYLHVSSASVYHKPVRRVPFTESTTRHNPFVPYSRDKIAAEEVLERAYVERDFPVTIVRPSHTYDDANPPLPGGWSAWDRVARGEEVCVAGDGTNLWTLTHAEDLAVGLVGLLGNWSAVGEDFHITSDEALPWDEIYRVIALTVGVAPRLVHLPAEFLSTLTPGWIWAELLMGDLGHSALFDNSKIRRYVPAFRPTTTWAAGARRLAAWRAAHPDAVAADAATDELLDRMVRGHHAARLAVATLAP